MQATRKAITYGYLIVERDDNGREFYVMDGRHKWSDGYAVIAKLSKGTAGWLSFHQDAVNGTITIPFTSKQAALEYWDRRVANSRAMTVGV